MPETIHKTFTVFQFEELSPEAQERAIDREREDPYRGEAWADEWRDTLAKATDALPFAVEDWEVDPWRGRTFARSRPAVGDDVEDLRGVRAWKWLRANVADLIETECPWTGVYSDEALLDPLRAFLRRPDTTSTVADVFQRCAEAWAHGWQSEIESQYEDDTIRQELSDRDMLYLENGEEFHG
jgi:hypothetical protein